MDNYSPLFAMILDSSIWEEPLHIRVVWIALLALRDKDQIVRIADHHLRRRANVSDEQLMDALKVLSEPDRRTIIPQEFEGRRIRRVDDGWLVLNGDKYQRLMQDINRRARLRKAQAKFREKAKGRGLPLPGEEAYVRGVENGTINPQTHERIVGDGQAT